MGKACTQDPRPIPRQIGAQDAGAAALPTHPAVVFTENSDDGPWRHLLWDLTRDQQQ